jgi:hypothetical protein
VEAVATLPGAADPGGKVPAHTAVAAPSPRSWRALPASSPTSPPLLRRRWWPKPMPTPLTPSPSLPPPVSRGAVKLGGALPGPWPDPASGCATAMGDGMGVSNPDSDLTESCLLRKHDGASKPLQGIWIRHDDRRQRKPCASVRCAYHTSTAKHTHTHCSPEVFKEPCLTGE